MNGPSILGVVAGLTAGAVFTTMFAERWHAQAFQRHRDALERYAADDDTDAISAEVERFHNDTRVDVATWLMQWGHPITVVLAVITGTLAAVVFA